MNQTDYLLTGAAGFLGSVLLKVLAANSSVKTLGRSVQSNYRIDLSKQTPEFTESFTTVIHASGKAHMIPKTQQDIDDFFSVNYQGTINLTEGLERLLVLPKHIVFISTVAVYGKEQGEGIDEAYPLLGATPYAKSKIRAEEFLQTWCGKNNVTLTILRLPLIVGAKPPGNLGAMLRLMEKGLYVGIGSGLARKSMVLSEDVARFIPIIQKIGGIYNLTDGNHPTMLEVENAIAKQIQKRKPIRLPDQVLKMLARIGDLIGDRSPLNTLKYTKLTSSLTFSDAKARANGWTSRVVINNLPF